jgi:hypothetical protein
MSQSGWRIAVCAASLSALAAAPGTAGTVKKLPETQWWVKGTYSDKVVQREWKTYHALDGAGAAPVYVGEVTSSLDRSATVLKRGGKKRTSGLDCDIDPSVDLAGGLRNALRFNLRVLGLRGAETPSGEAWQVTGDLRSFQVFNHVGIGAYFAWAYATTSWRLVPPGGPAQDRVLRTAMFFPLECGMGTCGDCGAASVVSGLDMASLDILARLNREVVKAPPHPDVTAYARRDAEAEEWFALGMSGATQTVPKLLEILAAEKDDGHRWLLIRALTWLGSADILPALTANYDAEDEDVRWHVLRAIDYLGVGGYQEFIRAKSATEQDLSCREMLSRLGAAPPPAP